MPDQRIVFIGGIAALLMIDFRSWSFIVMLYHLRSRQIVEARSSNALRRVIVLIPAQAIRLAFVVVLDL